MEGNIRMNENQPLVSVIMPVYNCERFLTEAIESVISQSYQNWELLIVDDGSKDKSVPIIESYVEKKEEEELARLKALHEEKDNLCKKEMSDNKKLNEDLERTIKIICLLKSYGSFVHKVLGLPFVFDSIPEVDSRERNFEVMADLILKNYEQMKTGSRPTILNDESLLILKFTEFEEKVIKILETKQLVDKEFTSIQKSYEDELKELQRREKR